LPVDVELRQDGSSAGTGACEGHYFTARLIGAEEACKIACWAKSWPTTKVATPRDELARTVASQAPLTLRATKEALRRIREKMNPEEESRSGSDVLHEP